MAKGVIAKKQVFSLLVVLTLVLVVVFVSAPIVQASTGGGTIVEPIPDKPQANSSGSGIDDLLLGFLLTMMSLTLIL